MISDSSIPGVKDEVGVQSNGLILRYMRIEVVHGLMFPTAEHAETSAGLFASSSWMQL
jgi:hypothetical protein